MAHWIYLNAMTAEPSINVLIFGRIDERGVGVVNFVETLKRSLSNDIHVEHFRIGLRTTIGARWLRPVFLVYDIIRLVILLSNSRFDVLQINASLNLKSLIRDALFLIVISIVAREMSVIIFFMGGKIELRG